MVSCPQSENDQSPRRMVDAYRRFTRTLETVSDFDQFQLSLREALEADPYLSNSLLTNSDIEAKDQASYDDSVYQKGRVVLPLRGDAEGSFITSAGRRDSKQFDASDIHLMGSMADFVSVLYAQANRFRKLRERENILQFLIDQLPVGVVCFNAAGELVSGNALAWRQLGLNPERKNLDEAPVLALLRDDASGKADRHFEVDGRLMFAMRRSFAPKGGESVDAHVIYDLSKRRERLAESLELECYKALSLEQQVSVALLRYHGEAGAIYDFMKQNAAGLQTGKDLVQPLEAYTCACVFPGSSVSSVRFLLKPLLRQWQGPLPEVFIFNPELPSAQQIDVEQLDLALDKLQAGDVALLPRVLVYDAYYPIFEMLELVLEGVANLDYVDSPNDAVAAMLTRQYDGIIIDIDSVDPTRLVRFAHEAKMLGASFRPFYTSVNQRSDVITKYGLSEEILFLQKPFDVAKVSELVFSQFDFA